MLLIFINNNSCNYPKWDFNKLTVNENSILVSPVSMAIGGYKFGDEEPTLHHTEK